MPFDPKKYIDSLDLDDAEKAAMQKIFAKEKNVAEMNRGYAARDEASRLMDEGTKAKTDAEAIKTAAAAEKAEALQIKGDVETERLRNLGWADALKKYESDTQRTAIEKTELAVKATAYENYLKTIGVEPSFALEGVDLPKAPPPPPAPRQEPPVPSPQAVVIDEEMLAKLGYAKREEVGRAATLLANLPFELNDLNARHRELYGADAPAAELKKVREAYLNPQNTRSLEDVGAEAFHFAEREAAKAEERLEAEAERRANEKMEARMSAMNLPSAALDTLTPASIETAMKFASKSFADNSGRAAESNATQIGQEEMQAFLQVNEELAQKGVHATP